MAIGTFPQVGFPCYKALDTPLFKNRKRPICICPRTYSVRENISLQFCKAYYIIGIQLLLLGSSQQRCFSMNMSPSNFFLILGVVSDVVPPVVTGCPRDIQVTAPPGSSTAIVTWTAPIATDDSNQEPSRFVSHEPGYAFTIGMTTTVTYIFMDESGNRAECTFNVVVSCK